MKKTRELYERESDEFLCLNSCGIQHFFERDAMGKREHGRIDYHFLYIAEGKCYVTLAEQTVLADEGSVILYRPNERQEYAFPRGTRSVSYYIHFSGRGCEEILRKLELYGVTVAKMGKSYAFEKCFLRMQRERAMGLIGSETICAGMLTQLLGIAARAIEMRKRGFATGVQNRITEVCRTVYENLRTVTVAELAESCFLSEGRFSHLFKESMGVSPMRYITEGRIKRAAELLAETELSVSAIGAAVGFANQNYFSRIFRKYIGTSPLKYRKLYSPRAVNV